jgi:hypothetical protein
VEWVSNIVPVEKNTGKIHVHIDFRNLNKATPKDEYPMPIDDMLINNASGHRVISFLDGNGGYNKIFMAVEDMSKMTSRCSGFISLFEWVVMTFGLKNTGVTYQRAMDLIFHDLLGIISEIYIDDVVVKSDSMDSHLVDLYLALERMHRYGLKMNLLKCVFGVSDGKFLGFIIREHGIEIDPTKIESIYKVQPPHVKNDMLKYIGKLNYLRWFIFNLSRKIGAFAPILQLKNETSLSCHFEKGPLCHRRSLSPFPLPPAPRAALCPSLLASCLGSASRARRRAASNSASLVSSPCAPPFFNPSGPTPTPLPPLAVGAHRSYRRPPEHCRR